MSVILGGKCIISSAEQMGRLSRKGCTLFEVHTNASCIDLAKIDEYKKNISDNGLELYCFHSPYNNLDGIHIGLGNKDNQEEFMRLMKDSIIMASNLIKGRTAKVVTHLHATIEMSEVYNNANVLRARVESIDLALKQLKELIEFIEINNYDVELCVENVWPNTGSMENPNLAMSRKGNSPRETKLSPSAC